ncbi:NAC domain-containing protein 12-like [Hibiscus syriacus]|uniref:NAC domain-containing protein 12-like n=1 Tax=Hibiscus syriacus TaxID=106335 RepID=A0A6A2ZTB1_HIBSY|nr:uncharacterized protein LOC120140000 [Hibiscus syriacus]KAE8694667.1 NAC domain-containing protein 12-like [Hibiscus syriacus]
MGNCLFGGLGEADGVIKVITSNGGVMEFSPPIIAGTITDEFPGHAIFRTQDLFWKPLFHHEELLPGESYYLLPLNTKQGSGNSGQIVREGHVRSNSIPAASAVAPYRMSCDYQGTLKRSHTDVLSRHNNNNSNSGFWKVKLVITPEQLLEILSQEARTQELIESVRTVAKCGNRIEGSVGFSDQWSLSSSRNASSNKDGFLLDI